MLTVESCCVPGNIAIIEMFTFEEEDLKQFVIYTYYNENEEPLYVGCSKNFYNAHYFNCQRFSWTDEIEYVGFIFMENEDDIKDAKKYYIKTRNPKYNLRKYKNIPLLPELEEDVDDLVVYKEQMERRWEEWLGQYNKDVEYKTVSFDGEAWEIPDCDKCPFAECSPIWGGIYGI